MTLLSTPGGRHDLLRWFDAAERPLPWRGGRTDAWGILLSEVMSQQTPVARVAPVWREWVERWPRPSALAAASRAEVLTAWGKLGYPRRALRLWECAGALAERCGDTVPADVDILESLPGIGQYTARAVTAFAYAQPVAVVDTNVRRVIARAVHGHPDQGRPRARDWADAAALLPPAEEEAATPGVSARWSAALMELGALVCTARTPSCEDCPLTEGCAWILAGRPQWDDEVHGRRPTPQKFAGTDRQVRGLILDVLRDGPASGTGVASATMIAAVWPDDVQRDRALASLLRDGLLEECPAPADGSSSTTGYRLPL